MSGTVVTFWWLVGIFALVVLGTLNPAGAEVAFYSISSVVLLGAWLDHRYDPRGALR